MRAVGGLRLEVLPGTWEPDPFVDNFFLIGNDLLFCIATVSYTHLRAHETKANLVCRLLLEKKNAEIGQAPTSQARPRDEDHLRPSNLAARTLSLVEHALSKFGGDPCPARRGLAAAVKCYVRKARFFPFC